MNDKEPNFDRIATTPNTKAISQVTFFGALSRIIPP